MPFEKGIKKTGGRKKGSVNRNTQIANAIIDKVLGEGLEEIGEIWDELSAKEKMDFIVKFLPFKLPQMARIENQNKVPQKITINMMPAQPKEIDNTINIKHEELDD